MTQPEQQRRNLEFNLAVAHQASRTSRQMMDVDGPDLPKLELNLGHLIGLTDHRDPLMAGTLRQEGKPDRGVVMLQSDLRTLPEGVGVEVARPCTPEANLIGSRLLRNRDPGRGPARPGVPGHPRRDPRGQAGHRGDPPPRWE